MSRLGATSHQGKVPARCFGESIEEGLGNTDKTLDATVKYVRQEIAINRKKTYF